MFRSCAFAGSIAKQHVVRSNTVKPARFDAFLPFSNPHNRVSFHQLLVKHDSSSFRGIPSTAFAFRRFLATKAPTLPPGSDNGPDQTKAAAPVQQNAASEALKAAELKVVAAKQERDAAEKKRDAAKQELDAAFQAWESTNDEVKKAVLFRRYQRSETALDDAQTALRSAQATYDEAQRLVSQLELQRTFSSSMRLRFCS
jgi:hypothetical protein